MRGKGLKWLSLIIPLILSLAVTTATSAPDTILYVDPSSVVDSSLQAPDTFTVDLKVADVSNLALWECNMSYDPSMVSATDVVFGDFLQGNPNETLESYATYHDTSVSYSSLTNPYGAHDSYLGTYASLNYSEADGRFWVYEFDGDPGGQPSQIVQVDLNVRYSATASGAGDQYRIVYYAFWGSEITLVDWTSDASALATHTWTNPTNPYGTPWDWGFLTSMNIAVQTDSVGGDPDAIFNLYEAWFTVTYLRPVGSYDSIDNVYGWVWMFQYSSGYPTGISGSGLLATVTFDVLDYGFTELDIDNAITGLEDPVFLDIPFTPESGYFRNLYPGDVDGDKYVGSADAGVVSLGYGQWRGDPNYVREADFDDDGYIGSYDAGVLSTNYGTTYP